MEQIKVLVVDDHSLFRGSVVGVIASQEDMQVVAEAENGREAIEKAREVQPDIVIMDLSMPVMGGVEATRLLLEVVPGANVLMLTISEKDEDLFDAMKAGARGYILKGADPEELVRAVTHIAQGGVIISPAMAPKLLAEVGVSKEPQKREELGLSPREREILALIADGLTDREIAEELFISVNTAKTHLKNILTKLQVKSRAQIVARGARAGLLDETRESP
ncbi:response regulator transcription factor [Dehalococcoidia bacterium]|nr:response regulator transcription factor [Dehalococcoidia bacterium]MCL0063984.1 response regulator transcription factor [Dehalococcoidia bacterium]MCL0092388.1 response regulator transcription factor [Dehalococcoidia bacterium]MCL0103258.1 response regulator transcription factor [Dehalococcoidia bacterium]